VYVSAKINKNCDLLYKYLVHRIYGLAFKTPALVVEKDAVFIPSGWDNEKKIAILYENIQSFSPDDNYNDIITASLNTNPTQKEQEIVAEDDQIFLIKLRTQLTQQVPTNANTPIRSTNTTPTVPKTDRRSTASITPSTPASAAQLALDSSKNSPGGEGVLQTFFNSLLSRKSAGGTPGGPPGSSASTPVSIRTSTSGTPSAAAAASASAAAESLRSRDVHAELDRIIEGNRLPNPSTPTQQSDSNC